MAVPSGGPCRSEVPTLVQRKKSIVFVAVPQAGWWGTTRFDPASALALNPVVPRPTEGLLSLPPLAEDTLTRSRAGYEGREFTESLASPLTLVIQSIPAGKSRDIKSR